MKLYICLSMIFLHIIDDFVLQAACLSNLKQKKWWKDHLSITENYEMYKYDYLVALFMHAFSWTFMIMLPIAIYQNFDISLIFVIAFGLNCIIHFLVDDLKANKKLINLQLDQSIHISQILVTALIFLFEF